MLATVVGGDTFVLIYGTPKCVRQFLCSRRSTRCDPVGRYKPDLASFANTCLQEVFLPSNVVWSSKSAWGANDNIVLYGIRLQHFHEGVGTGLSIHLEILIIDSIGLSEAKEVFLPRCYRILRVCCPLVRWITSGVIGVFVVALGNEIEIFAQGRCVRDAGILIDNPRNLTRVVVEGGDVILEGVPIIRTRCGDEQPALGTEG